MVYNARFHRALTLLIAILLYNNYITASAFMEIAYVSPSQSTSVSKRWRQRMTCSLESHTLCCFEHCCCYGASYAIETSFRGCLLVTSHSLLFLFRKFSSSITSRLSVTLFAILSYRWYALDTNEHPTIIYCCPFGLDFLLEFLSIAAT